MQPLIPYFDPIQIPLGPVSVHGFGILVAIGFITGSWLAMRKARKDGLDPDIINRAVTWIIAGVFIGGHLGHALFYEPAEHFADPIKFLMFWKGLSSTGGFIGCTILTILFLRRENARVRRENVVLKEAGEPLKRPIWVIPYGDTLMYGLSLGWFFGRLGCFSAHDHPGTATDFYLGVYGMCPDQPVTIACHDLGLYEAIWAGGMFLLFLFLNRKPRFQGFYIGLLCVAYGPFRLFLDAFRHPATDVRYFGLTPAQYGSVVIGLIGVYILYSQRKTTPIQVLSEQADAADAAARQQT
ncbi:MAG: phosphatidylglycerol:prolipoprotein diacylglycerol transferase [Myxococcota bacterium]|jgi:phosphatidylglycerol:prolipoprotein diacylglycerol transferase